jgi:hypothetical protein
MDRKLFLDIETLPPSEEVRDRIVEEIQDDRAHREKSLSSENLQHLADERFRELALSGEYGRILTIGVILEEDGKVKQRGVFGRDRETQKFHLDEARTLKAFWNFVCHFDLRNDLIIGHNILDFDLPFILKRSVIHQIRPRLPIPFRRFQRQPVFDTMWEWNCWRNRISLDELSGVLGVSSPKTGGLDGSLIYDAWRAGRDQEIADYCLRDVECVREIYYRMIFAEAASFEAQESAVASQASDHRVQSRVNSVAVLQPAV